MMSSIARLAACAGFATLAMQTPAFAHYVMGGKRPRSGIVVVLAGGMTAAAATGLIG